MSATERYNYVYSCDLESNLQIKIGTLEGHGLLESGSAGDRVLLPCPDVYVTCEVYAGQDPITLPTQTAYKPFIQRINWNEWLTLPIAYCDVPRNAELVFTVWQLGELGQAEAFGKASVPLFTRLGTVQTSLLDLIVNPCHGTAGSSTNRTGGESATVAFLSELTRKYREGRIEKIDWLDRLTFREIEIINERHKKKSTNIYLMVEFPRLVYNSIDFDIVYFEMGGDKTVPPPPAAEIVFFNDEDMLLPNLIENKHHQLARSVRSSTSDRDLKPDALTRELLKSIVNRPPTQVMTSEEEDLVWKFRFYLCEQKKALTKLLKCVRWSEARECKEALFLMDRWSAVDVEDALELLSPYFQYAPVRRYAVSRLQQATDEDLLLYLLQLVQALRYEATAAGSARNSRDGLSMTATLSPGNDSHISDAVGSPSNDHQDLVPPEDEAPRMEAESEEHSSPGTDLSSLQVPPAHIKPKRSWSTSEDLKTFLFKRAFENFKVANYLFWYLSVEAEDLGGNDTGTAQYQKYKEMYTHLLKELREELRLCRPDFEKHLSAQVFFMEKLVALIRLVAKETGTRKRKMDRLQQLLTDAETFGKDFCFASFEPFPLPLDPEVSVTGIESSSAHLFKSALCPARLTFITVDRREFITIFKDGDDLRQDQLVLQMINLMDKLLRRENLDLRLKPYKVLATGSRHGFVQFVDSYPVAQVLANEGTISNFFCKYGPSESNPTEVAKDVMDNYVRSCAGYCVITYLLGVGDRHLDNLMLTKSGQLFHIDFGYILGRDPKPMPPPMKLTKEMVDAMGGPRSDHFKVFTELCFTAFFHLRRSANLILNLFSLMVDANVPDIVLEPDKTVKKVQDKFLLNLTDEEAVKELQGLIDASVYSLMPTIVEKFHTFMQYMRK